MHLDGDDEKDEKSPAQASSKYPTLLCCWILNHRAYAWPIIVYSKQDISQLPWRMQYIFGKLFGNSGHTFSSIFLKPRSEARVNVTQKQYATFRNPKMYSRTNFWNLYLS